MIFNSLGFLAFFAVVLVLHYMPLPWTVKKFNLLLASYFFYAAWNPPFALLLAFSTVVDWRLAKWMFVMRDGRVALFDSTVIRHLSLDEETSQADLAWLVDKSRAANDREYRRVRIDVEGTSKDLRVAYTIPAPMWRVSYRVVVEDDDVTLMAWADSDGVVSNQHVLDFESATSSQWWLGRNVNSRHNAQGAEFVLSFGSEQEPLFKSPTIVVEAEDGTGGELHHRSHASGHFDTHHGKCM